MFNIFVFNRRFTFIKHIEKFAGKIKEEIFCKIYKTKFGDSRYFIQR